jgi:hypothetical protein
MSKLEGAAGVFTGCAKEDVTLWLDSPVTKALEKKVRESIENLREQLVGRAESALVPKDSEVKTLFDRSGGAILALKSVLWDFEMARHYVAGV